MKWMALILMLFGLTSCFWSKKDDAPQVRHNVPSMAKQEVVYNVQPLHEYEGDWVQLDGMGKSCTETYLNYDKFKDSYRMVFTIDNDIVTLEYQGFLYSDNCRGGKKPAELIDRVIAKGRLYDINKAEKIYRFQIRIIDIQRVVGDITYDYKGHTLIDELKVPVYNEGPACNFEDWKVGTYSLKNTNYPFYKNCGADFSGSGEMISLNNPLAKSWRIHMGGVYYIAIQMLDKNSLSVERSDKSDVQPTGIKNAIRLVQTEESDEEAE